MTEVSLMFGGFLLLITLGIPIGVSMGLAGMLTIVLTGSSAAFFQAIVQKMYTGIDSFTLMAIPFFLLAGNLMDRGGISKRLIDLFKLVLRRVPATTAIITTVTSAFFGALTGSSPATCAAIGGITIPVMEKEGYSKGDATAIAAASGVLGPIIPPSIPMITFGVCASVSISAMFIAGIVPGILLMFAYIAVELIRYRKVEARHKDKLAKGELWTALKNALLALGMPVIILGGIYGGFFTPTEAAAISCLYAIIVAGPIYRVIGWKDLPSIFIASAKSTAMILFVLCMASGYAWLMTNFGLIQIVSDLILGLGNKVLILIVINVILLILGCFIDQASIIIITTPILLPVADSIGMSYIAMGLLIVLNTTCGAMTPPMAPNLYIAANIAKSRSIGPTTKSIFPLLGAAIVVMLIVTYIPQVVLWLPRVLGAAM